MPALAGAMADLYTLCKNAFIQDASIDVQVLYA